MADNTGLLNALALRTNLHLAVHEDGNRDAVEAFDRAGEQFADELRKYVLTVMDETIQRVG